MEIIKTYLLGLIVFLGIDAVWLTTMNQRFYGKYLSHLMTDKPNLTVALVFYLINILGMVFLVINPAIKEQSLSRLIWGAALYGLCTYATYDLTNMATLKNWPIVVTVVDLVWGVTLSTVVCVVVYLLRK